MEKTEEGALVKIETLPEKEVKDLKELYRICTPVFVYSIYFPEKELIFKQLKKAKKKLEEMGV